MRYQDLVVWQRAMRLVEEVYKIVAGLPPEEKYGLASQLRRAAISVPANIAEGYGRGQAADYRRHLSIATGSLFELQTDLDLVVRLRLVPGERVNEALQNAWEIGLMLSSLRRRVGTAKPRRRS